MKSCRGFVIAALVFSATLGSSARAQSPVSVDSLQKRLEEIDQKARILERKWELAQKEAEAKAKEAPALVAGRDGFSLQSVDGNFLLRLRAHTQMDTRYFNEDERRLTVNTFLIRRLRFNFEGTLAKIFDFKFMPDFAGSQLVLQDSYLDARLWPAFKVRAGKFKTPFGIERLQSPTNLMLIERALPNNLVPNRDIGVQLHGDLAGGIFSYAAGIFNGVRDGGSADSDPFDSKDFAGRLMLAPFSKTKAGGLRNLNLGIAGTIGTHEGTRLVPNLPVYNSPGVVPIFAYRTDGTEAGTTYASGTVTRFSPQGYYAVGPLGVLSEYVISSQEITRAASSAKLENRAWQVAASCALTGEPASYRGITPKKSFDHTRGAWGSFEIAARYHQLEIDKDAFPVFANPQAAVQKATAWALGLNWYLNRNVKLLLNYEQTAFTGGAASGDRPGEKVILTRFQIAY